MITNSTISYEKAAQDTFSDEAFNDDHFHDEAAEDGHKTAGELMSLSGLVVILLVLFAGCTTLPVSPPDASNPIAKVAVLPIHNSTSDMNGPAWVRTGISEMVLAKHYLVIPNDQVDQVLREKMGVTLGGQLDYTNPATGAPLPDIVGQTLDVDGLLYCNLEDFQSTTTLNINRRKIRVRCSLVNVKTATIVWEKEEVKSAFEINARPEDLTAVLIKACRYNPLEEETAVVIDKMKSTFPSGPVAAAEEQDGIHDVRLIWLETKKR